MRPPRPLDEWGDNYCKDGHVFRNKTHYDQGCNTNIDECYQVTLETEEKFVDCGSNGCTDGNCNSPTCTDFDSDNYFHENGCGTEQDCDDTDETVYPGAPEKINDNVDQDCDGSDFHVEAQNGTIDDIGFVDTNDDRYTDGKPDDLIYGLIEIDIDVTATGNDRAQFTVMLPAAAPAYYIPYKHTDADGWIDFSRDVISGGTGDGAVFNADRTELTVYVTDNDRYDENPTVGLIGDPIGVAAAPQNQPNPQPQGQPSTPSSGGGGGGGGGG